MLLVRREDMLDLLHRAIRNWNHGRLDAFLDCFREDAVLFTPFMNELFAQTEGWLQGRDELRSYLRNVAFRYEGATVVDAFVGVRFYALVLQEGVGSQGVGSLGMLLEPDEDSLLFKRLLLFKSIMRPGYND